MEKVDWSAWLAAALDLSGLTQAELGEEVGLTQVKLSNVKRGVRELSYEEAMAVSRATGLPMPFDTREIDVIGYVGAGAEVYPIDDGDPLHRVEIDVKLPPGTVGAIVRGDSMYPIFEDGDLIAYGGDPLPPEKAVGSTCIVQLADGRMLIKKVRNGTQRGLYTLTSSNAPDIEDVPLEWARAFVLRLSRDFWRKCR